MSHENQAVNPENDFAKLGWYSGVLLQLKKESYFWIEGKKPASLSQIQNETNTTELILGTEGFKLLKKDACVLFLGFHKISVELPNDDLSKDENQEPVRVCVQRNVLKFLTDTVIVFLDYNSIANSNQTLANIFAIYNKDFNNEPPQKI